MAGLLTVVSGPGPVQGNGEVGHFVCLLCQFTAKGWETIQRHADQAHPTRATRIEQLGLVE